MSGTWHLTQANAENTPPWEWLSGSNDIAQLLPPLDERVFDHQASLILTESSSGSPRESFSQRVLVARGKRSLSRRRQQAGEGTRTFTYEVQPSAAVGGLGGSRRLVCGFGVRVRANKTTCSRRSTFAGTGQLKRWRRAVLRAALSGSESAAFGDAFSVEFLARSSPSGRTQASASLDRVS